MQTLSKQRLEASIRECDRHLQRLEYAYRSLAHLIPVSALQLQNLNEEDIKSLDQYIYRFTKLQDAMGLRLFKSLLETLAEDVERMTWIDRLNRLEKITALPSATRWLELRQLRNKLTHEYEEDTEQQAELLNLLLGVHKEIADIYETMKKFASKKIKE